GDLGVLSGRRDLRRVDARALHGCDRDACRPVIRGVDADEAVLAESGNRLLHLGLGLRGGPARRVELLGDLVARFVDDRVRALSDRGLGMRLLLRRVLRRVRVQDLAAGAELPDVLLEQRPVQRLVASRLVLGQEEGDLAALSAAAGSARRARAARAARALVA